MCGILGFVGRRDFDTSAFTRALETMSARGPDDHGVFEGPDVLLGHHRLSIVDLSPSGHQPMESDDGRFVISYNGEVYNYGDIRRDLERQGVPFRSTSDTEVILQAFVREGVSCLDRFRGMFAFGIYDRREKSLFLARDRMGIKPLYIWKLGASLAFASEVKALRALPGGPSEPSHEAVRQYLLWGSVPEPLTITAGIESLPPGSWLRLDGGVERRGTYWHPPVGAAGLRSRNEVLEEMRPVLRDAVALRCIADVPVGAFLSGGIDSSAVVALMRQAGQRDLHTFSISFPGTDLDEAPFANEVARQFGTQHVNWPVEEGVVRGELESFFSAMDQPTIDGLNTFLVSRAAREGGLKVALSGVGGDELFGGYPSFRRIATAEPFLRRVPESAIRAGAVAASRLGGRAAKLSALQAPGSLTERLYFAARGLFMPGQVQELLRRDTGEATVPSPLLAGRDPAFDPSTGSPCSRTMHLELRRYMLNQLLRDTDVFGMAHGLEVRVPLVDHVLTEMLFRTDESILLQGAPKSLLVDALPGPLPRACVQRRKMGFAVPLGRWMKGPWRPLIEETLLATTPAGAAALFRREAVQGLWKRFLDGGVHWSKPWALFAAMRAPAVAHAR